MNHQIIGLICGIVHLILSFLLALIATFGAFRIFDKLTPNIDGVAELKANNVAVSVMLSGMLLSSAIIMKTVVQPAISTLQVYLYQGITGLSILKIVGFVGAYIAAATILGIAVIWGTVSCFMALTHMTQNLDELWEIKKNNVAVAITLATVLVIIGFLLADGIDSILKAVIPFPAFQEIQIQTR
jgi:uncharacterized membrane protein YjfL (UPF0719 family)